MTVALVIGLLVLIGLLVDRLGWSPDPWRGSPPWTSFVGFGIVGLFVRAWAVAVAVWRLGRIEERWAPEGI